MNSTKKPEKSYVIILSILVLIPASFAFALCFSQAQSKANDDRFLNKAFEFTTQSGFDDFKDIAYLDGDVFAIGYGSHFNLDNQAIMAGDMITKEEAKKLFDRDAKRIIHLLNKHVKVPVTENQKVALFDLVYEIGDAAFLNSELLKKLNLGDHEAVAQALLDY